MTNLSILEFKQTIQNFVKSTDLPDEVKRMVLSDILIEQEKITYEVLRREITERDRLKQEASGNAEST